MEYIAKDPNNMHSIPRGTDHFLSLLFVSNDIFWDSASILILSQPGPPGLVFLQKLIKVCEVSGLVKKVTINQIKVVTNTAAGNL